MMDELCDEEKSYIDWVCENIPFINQNKDSLKVMKKVYMDGFAAGFHHHHKIRAEEQLQK